MRPVLEKLFGSGQEPPKAGQHTTIDPASVSEPASASGGDDFCQTRDEDSKSEKVSRIFDSIGRRNETLRAKLDSIEFSFRNIEAIRTQFHDALTFIDQTLVEIERTKVAHLAAERKLENLAAANDRLKSDRAGLTIQRDGLAVAQDELLARVADLERAVTEGEAASSEVRVALGWPTEIHTSRPAGRFPVWLGLAWPVGAEAVNAVAPGGRAVHDCPLRKRGGSACAGAIGAKRQTRANGAGP